MILEYEGYDVLEGVERAGRRRAGRARERRIWCSSTSRCPAWTGSTRFSGSAPQRRAAGRDHLRPRHRQHRGRGDQGGRLRLHREAADHRARAGHHPQCARPTRLADENRSLKRAVEVRHQMVGESPALRQVWDAIKRASPTNATVLLLGESGAGKELVARSIHRNSLRSRERFVQVNCAAIPEELIESELFGHEKGSFTGATEKQIGKFEQADRGTIFLDEVGDMSPKTQAKVLRVLQEGEVERLGSARTIKVDVRVIAATNKDLEAGDREGHLPRGSLLPSERDPDPRAAAPRPPRGHPGAGPALRGSVQPRQQPAAAALHAGGARVPAAGPLEGQRPRTEEHRRAADHHDARARSSTSTTSATSSGSTPRPAAGGADGEKGTLREFKETVRARVPGRQAARERLEHLEDRRGDRHAAQQSVQEAGTVRHRAGNGRIRSPPQETRRSPPAFARQLRKGLPRVGGPVPKGLVAP